MKPSVNAIAIERRRRIFSAAGSRRSGNFGSSVKAASREKSADHCFTEKHSEQHIEVEDGEPEELPCDSIGLTALGRKVNANGEAEEDCAQRCRANEIRYS